jgi:hypothetical protein
MSLFTGIPHKEYLNRHLRQKVRAQSNLSVAWTNPRRVVRKKKRRARMSTGGSEGRDNNIVVYLYNISFSMTF